MPEQVATPPASDGAPAEPANATPEPAVETPQSAEPQAGVSRPAEPKSTGSELTGSRPAESQSAEPKSGESRPAEPKSKSESKSTGSELTESTSAESTSAESTSTEPGPAEPRPTGPESGSGSGSGASRPAEPEPGEPRAAGSESTGSEPAESEAAEPEPQKSGALKALGIVGAILAVLVVAGLKFGVVSAIGNLVNRDETADAKAGDCIAKLPEVTGTKQEKVTNARIVECTSTEAAYNVVGRVDGQTEAQAKAPTACEQFFKPAEEGYIYSSIKPGKTGYVLCLTKRA